MSERDTGDVALNHQDRADGSRFHGLVTAHDEAKPMSLVKPPLPV